MYVKYVPISRPSRSHPKVLRSSYLCDDFGWQFRVVIVISCRGDRSAFRFLLFVVLVWMVSSSGQDVCGDARSCASAKKCISVSYGRHQKVDDDDDDCTDDDMVDLLQSVF
jgi:hypothetical protein